MVCTAAGSLDSLVDTAASVAAAIVDTVGTSLVVPDKAAVATVVVVATVVMVVVAHKVVAVSDKVLVSVGARRQRHLHRFPHRVVATQA